MLFQSLRHRQTCRKTSPFETNGARGNVSMLGQRLNGHIGCQNPSYCMLHSQLLATYQLSLTCSLSPMSFVLVIVTNLARCFPRDARY